VFAVALRLAQEVEKKEGKEAGRLPTYPDHFCLALLILRSY